MWWKNFIFLVLCLVAVTFVARQLLTEITVPEPAGFNAQSYQHGEFRDVVTQVDRAFEAGWQKAELSSAPPAPTLQVIRRLSLGLTGTIPSVQEIRALETVPAGDQVQWWLSYLFEDRRYSDYMAERFARTYVGVENGPFLVYRRRRLVNWISDAIHQNRPYDQMVRELIASKGTWTSNPEVNFVTVTIDQNNDEEGPDQVKLAARVTRAFLGVRIDCVQCHDDKFGDRWKQQDFHQLAAFFAGAEMSLTGVHDKETPYTFRYLHQKEEETVPPVVPFSPELLPEEGELRERLASWVTHPDNQAFARTTVNRIWALMFNQPLVDPIDEIPLDDDVPAALDILAEDLVANEFDLHRLIRVIAATSAFQQESRSAPDGSPVTEKHYLQFAAFPLTRLRPEQVAGSLTQSSSLQTLDAETHILVRLARYGEQNSFLKRFGDIGEDEFAARGGTIPQRLLMMNGELVHERTKDEFLANAAPRIAALAPDDQTAVETAYLATLTRRPTPEEKAHFTQQLEHAPDKKRSETMQDLFWTLINSTEFTWSH